VAATWLVEEGIGETRAALVEGGTILAARIDWAGENTLAPGLVAPARVASRIAGTRRGTLVFDNGAFENGATALVDGLTPALPEGASGLFRVTRAAIAEKGRTKLPMARPAGPAEQACPAPTLAQTLTQTGHPVRLLPVTDRSLDEAGWDEVMEEAMSGQIAFARGGLCISPTPAMTLIDVDGFPRSPPSRWRRSRPSSPPSPDSTSAARSASTFPPLPKSATGRRSTPRWARRWPLCSKPPAGARNARR
jgi:hypothetical protein